MAFTSRIDVFHGRVSTEAAHIYARVTDLPGGGEWKLTGRLRGPYCQRAHSLPATTPFVDCGAGPSLLAHATLTDPCTWSPELPAYYQVTVELHCGKQVVDSLERLLGIRSLGVSGRNFYWEGKRWVLRGVQRQFVDERPWSEWRDLCAAMVVDQPGDELCQAASLEGALIVARCEAGHADVPGELRRLAQWPAVAVTGVETEPRDVERDADWRSVAPNLLLACSLAGDGAGMPPWAHVAVVDSDVLTDWIGDRRQFARPILALRSMTAPSTLATARAACDLLQRDLALVGDFAGYLV